MSDLFQGQTMTYGAKFISDGAAHTFTFPFQPDKVHFYNYTKSGTSDTYVESVWFRGFPAGDAILQGLGTSPAAKMTLETTNGFTVADTDGGVSSRHATISGITAADPVVITHSTYTFQTNQQVMITDLGDVGVSDRGMGQINNKIFSIVVLGATTFSLKDPITGEPVDGTAFTAYVSGGRITLLTNVISLNNPQVSPYSNSSPYNPNAYSYDPVEYKLTAGSAVMGADSDVFYIEAIKFGEYVDLGDIA
jgi:hypothetical protein